LVQLTVPRVRVFGSLNVDLVAYVDQLPKPGQTRHGKRFLTAAGGKGLNQAIAAALAGAEVSMIGSVGSDEHGRWLTQTAAYDGIDTHSIVSREDFFTGVALIEVNDRGENSIIIVAGANHEAEPALLRANPGDIVLAQSGATTILNPAPATSLPPELLSLTDILIPNEHEASQISDIDTSANNGAIAAANVLLAAGVTTCLITLGARGAILVDIDGVRAQPAFGSSQSTRQPQVTPSVAPSRRRSHSTRLSQKPSRLQPRLARFRLCQPQI
jgi:ribokinase